MFSRIVRRVAFAVALFAASCPAIGQQFPIVPGGTVIGRSQFGPGPAQAISFNSLISLLLSSAPDIPTINTNSIIFKGSTSGQATVKAQAVAGTPTLNLPTVSGTIPSTATAPIQIDPLTGVISCPTCATSTSTASPVVASRALAQTLNLSAVSGIVTAGYATAGDGGGATFKNVGSAAFIDSFVPTGTGGGTITNQGNTCTNGTYYGVSPTGGNGHGLQGIAVVSGGVLASFTVTGTGGNGYSVNDVLTIPTGTIPCTTQPTWKVTGVSTATGSFTDSVGTRFQIVIDQGNYINVRQFGAILNYNPAAGDSAATDDGPAIQNAINFASWGVGFPDAGGFTGHTVIVPQGASKVCNGLMVPTNVVLTGVEESGTELKECDADPSSLNFITLGDPNNRQSSFNNGIHNMTLFGTSSAACSSCAMVFSNSAQYGDAVSQVAIYPITRGCILYNTGWGGTSDFEVRRMYCVPNDTLTVFGVSISGTFGFSLYNSQFSSGGSPWSGAAITINGGGYNDIVSVHCENMNICLESNVSTAGTITHVAGMVGQAALNYLVDIVPGSQTGTVVGENFVANGTGCTVFVSGACTVTGNSTARGVC